MLVALLWLVVQSTLAPALGWSAGIWTPNHTHITINGAPVPAHSHAWDVRHGVGPQDEPGCAAPASAAQAAPSVAAKVVCVADESMTPSVTAPMSVASSLTLLPFPGDEVPAASLPSRSWSSVVLPVLVPPPIQ